ncbi:hypothetical protein [Bacillus solitudinis]|uniref:hypothetical protein n=1 Tax=Bacillus solitudinis TaxID=2014074 RepID=UPI000C23BD31|nr:hypothetical protein [Bacillus solitudinis]
MNIVREVQEPSRFNPHVLDLKGVQNSKGNNKSVATVRIELPKGFVLEDIDVESIQLNGAVKPVKGDVQVTETQLSVMFSRQDLLPVVEEGDEVPSTTRRLLGKPPCSSMSEETKLKGILKLG